MKKTFFALFFLLFIGFAYSFCEDVDGDGYGIKALDCEFSALDCDDSNPNINPGKKEVCSNGVDEDCNGKDKTCMLCHEGEIFFRCSCEGSIYEKGAGYCCSNVFQETPCPWCTEPLGTTVDCVTEQGCPGGKGCITFIAPVQYSECYDVPDDNCPCIEEWQCESWSECINGKTTRSCTDKKNCGTIKFKPKTASTCTKETKKMNVKILKNTVKENESITLMVSFNNKPLPSAKVEYSGKTFLTDFSGKASITAVYGQNKIKVSKEGYDLEELTINVMKEIDASCGNNYCDEKENEFNCPIDCKKENGQINGKKNGNDNGDKNWNRIEDKSSCGNSVCDKGENISNCFTDCFNPRAPESIIFFGIVIFVFILFIVTLARVK